MLANDIYMIRVTAQDTSGNLATQTFELALEGQAKIGNYRTSFPDLSIPLAGLPITIGRTYDTLDAGYSGDFGYGWTLDIGTPRIRESVRVSASVLGKPSDYRAAQDNPAGKSVHHLGAKGHRKHERVREILSECCIGINSALNTVPLTDDQHYRQGLHSHKNLDGVTKVIKSANRKGCEFDAGALRDLANRNGKVN